MILLRRILALNLLVAFTTSGSGLPMCLESLVQLAAPCEMHDHHAGHGAGGTGEPAARQLPVNGHDTHFSGSAESRDRQGVLQGLQSRPCHDDASEAGCLETDACPTAGTPAPGTLGLEAGSLASTHASFRSPAAPFPSFLAPPLAPPPQA